MFQIEVVGNRGVDGNEILKHRDVRELGHRLFPS